MTGPTVHLYSADEGGCGHNRMMWPGWALNAAGYDVHPFYGQSDSSTRLQVAWQDLHTYRPDGIYKQSEVAGVRHPGCDVTVWQRPLRRHTVDLFPFLQEQGVAVVVEVDDDFQAIDPRSTAYADCDPRRKPGRNWRHLARACDLADHVIVSTPALARRYGKHGRVSVIPNYVPARYLDISKPGHDGPPIVGWAGETSTHAADLTVVGSALAELVRSDVCQFRNVGRGQRVAEQLGLDDRYTRADAKVDAEPPWWAAGWVDLPDYPYAVASFDVGLVPLQLSQFNEAKSALKGLEYASTGTWSVASPTGPYSAVSGQICWTADKPTRWKGVLRDLFRDHVAMGEQARATVRARDWTYEAQCGRWWDAYVQAADYRASVMMTV